ncbi:MAG: ATP-binding cassette domain-containing protein [Lachnospiraceae bacterium]|nr:ATP-binding cassette domain-containing protein [Lachnospiraceae bacterium]
MMNKTIRELTEQYPYINIYLDDFDINFDENRSFEENLKQQPDHFFEQRKMSFKEVLDEFEDYLDKAKAILEESIENVDDITIYPGKGKDGVPEPYEEITVHPGEIIAIVGETGSGKSRLLEDIEWQAEKDTPTGRTVIINGMSKKERRKTSGRQRLIAQLSQNMNFVLDMNVDEFLKMHAECFVSQGEVEVLVKKVYETAISLSGEEFSLNSSITGLSGGQSRALMIADCAYISRAPIVLIDEIENAGIDIQRAMKILVGSEKIVFIATHDPVLALFANKRIVIRNGAVSKIIERNEEEEKALHEAEKLYGRLLYLRNRIRSGEKISQFGGMA